MNLCFVFCHRQLSSIHENSQTEGVGLSLIHICKTPGKLSFLRFQKIGGMDFLGNILAVHFIQDILERGNIVVIPQGVDTVIHGDIADTVSWEKVLNLSLIHI